MENLKDLLDDFYGESRSDDHKKEVVTFIENYWELIREIMVGEAEDSYTN